jgi:hypothetical protein
MTLQGKLQNWTWLTALSVVLAGCSSTASRAPVAPEMSTAPKRAMAPAEAVTWQNVVGCTLSTDNNLSRTRSSEGWTSGASSTRGLAAGDGYAEFTVPASAGMAMFGLSNGDTDQNYPDIDYAFYTYPPTGQLMAFESGVFQGQFGAYAAGDELRIAVENGVVKYYRNGALVHTSAAAPTFPLRVDTALYSYPAAVQGAVLGGTLVWVVTPSAVTWQNVVSCIVSTDTLTKTGSEGWTGGASSDLGLATDGYAEFTVPPSAGVAMMGLSFGDASVDYSDINYAFYTYPPTGQLMAFESGVFQGQFGAYAAGDKLRIAVEAGLVNYYWNGALVFTSAKTPTFPLRVDTALYSIGAVVQDAVLGGLSYQVESSRVDEYWWQNEAGVAINRSISHSGDSGDVVTKTASNGWNNGGASSTLGLSAAGDGYVDFVVPTNPGFAMFGLNNGDTNHDYRDIDYAFYTYPPTGQLMVFENGVFQGEFGAYAPGDVLRVAVENGVVKYYRNSLNVYASAAAPRFPLRIDTAIFSRGTSVISLGINGDTEWVPNLGYTEGVTWQNAVGVSSDGVLTKTASNGWGNGGASSTRGLSAAGDGYAEFSVPWDPGFAMFGLSNGDADQDYPDIDYAFYVFPQTNQPGKVMVFENGTFRSELGAYQNGDRLRIAAENGIVKYYWNGLNVYTSAKTPTFPLRIDTALYSTGAIVDAAVDLITQSVVDWQNPIGVAISGGVVTKTAPNGWNNGGASSTRGLSEALYGFVDFVVPTNPGFAMFGLSNGDTNHDYRDIDYAFYTYPPTGQLMVFENGVVQGEFGAYAPGDQLSIVVGDVVDFYWNGVSIYTSAAAPTFPLRVDTAIFSMGTSVEVAHFYGDFVDVTN